MIDVSLRFTRRLHRDDAIQEDRQRPGEYGAANFLDRDAVL
jgi:hypothetical protein